MGRRLSDWLGRVANGWVALAATLVFVAFVALVLPRQAAASRAATGGVESPDTALIYAPSDLYRVAELYGPEGRAAYVRARWTFDVIWPLVYGAFLATAISWVFWRAAAPGSRWRLANLAPPLGVAFDFLENSATSLVIGRYPARTPGVDLLAPAFSAAKWLFVNGSFALLLGGALVAAWRAWAARRDR